MTEYVYLNRNNPISFILKEGGSAISSTDMGAISKVAIQYQGHAYTSASWPSSFDYATYASDAKIIAYLGTLGLSVGRDYEAELLIYSPTNPEGLLWDTIDLEVIDDSATDPDLTVEDGSVVTSANTYVSLANFNTYCNDRGYSLANSTPVSRKQAILRAMIYIESRGWKGVKTDQDNALQWPRNYVYDRDEELVGNGTVPSAVVNALCEAAYREFLDSGTLNDDMSAYGSVKRKVVGPLETEYFEGKRRKSFPIFKRMLAGYIKGGGSIDLVRT